LNVLQSVIDSSFESAHIVSVFLYEKDPSNDTTSFLDVKYDCLLEDGFEVRPNEIQISFSYIPNIYMLTKLLKNWYTGLYFVVTIDVHYKPNGSGKRSMMGSQVRLQIPTRDVDGPSIERTKAQSSNFKIKEVSKHGKRSDSKVDLKDFTMEKAKTVSEQYQRESRRNEVLMVFLGGTFIVTMLIILITIIIVIVKHKRKSQTTIIQLQTL